MDNTTSSPATIDEYIAQFPPDVQTKMQALRKVIREAAPQAGEKISWAMPTFTLHGNLVHFAAFKRHIGFYPGANGIASFLGELSAYQTSKGAVQFPLDKPIPFELVTRIVKFSVAENVAEAEAKKKKKK